MTYRAERQQTPSQPFYMTYLLKNFICWTYVPLESNSQKFTISYLVLSSPFFPVLLHPSVALTTNLLNLKSWGPSHWRPWHDPHQRLHIYNQANLKKIRIPDHKVTQGKEYDLSNCPVNWMWLYKWFCKYLQNSCWC
jgi:hypothetical protein